MTTASCWIISNVSSPQGTGIIAPDSYSAGILWVADSTRMAGHRRLVNFEDGAPEQRMIPGFPGEMEEGHFETKERPHPDYRFTTPTHWRMRAEKWRKRLTIQ
jgi:hypothetical protein